MNMPKQTGSIRHKDLTRSECRRASLPAMKVPASTKHHNYLSCLQPRAVMLVVHTLAAGCPADRIKRICPCCSDFFRLWHQGSNLHAKQALQQHRKQSRAATYHRSAQ